MSKRIYSLTFLALLVAVCAGCGGGGGGGQSALPGGNAATMLMWDAPSTNTDGSPATDLAGYKIYYGTAPGIYTASMDVGNTTSIPVATLSSSVPSRGLYYISVTAYDTAGNESIYSNTISQSL